MPRQGRAACRHVQDCRIRVLPRPHQRQRREDGQRGADTVLQPCGRRREVGRRLHPYGSDRRVEPRPLSCVFGRLLVSRGAPQWRGASHRPRRFACEKRRHRRRQRASWQGRLASRRPRDHALRHKRQLLPPPSPVAQARAAPRAFRAGGRGRFGRRRADAVRHRAKGPPGHYEGTQGKAPRQVSRSLASRRDARRTFRSLALLRARRGELASFRAHRAREPQVSAKGLFDRPCRRKDGDRPRGRGWRDGVDAGRRDDKGRL